MIRKKILVIISTFGMGGTVSSLKAMLSLIDHRLVEFDVFALYKVGPNINSLSNANILKESVWLSASIKETRGLKRYVQILLRIIKNLLSFFQIDVTPFYVRMGAKELHLEQYDCVISYSEDLTKFVSLFPVKHKIAWTHSVYSRYLELTDRGCELNYYKCFDYIICVSEYAKMDFISVYDSLKEKVKVIYNCCDEKKLTELSKAYIPEEFNRTDKLRQFYIVSVGRLDPVKQFSAIPRIASVVKAKLGSCFKWFIIGGACGDGKEANTISSKIVEYQVGDIVSLLGGKENPYPYIVNSDVFVHTSLSETFGMVVQEALALGVPAVLNNYGSAYEMVIDGVNGRVVPISQIADVLINMIRDHAYYQGIKNQTMITGQKESILHKESPTLLVKLI